LILLKDYGTNISVLDKLLDRIHMNSNDGNN